MTGTATVAPAPPASVASGDPAAPPAAVAPAVEEAIPLPPPSVAEEVESTTPRPPSAPSVDADQAFDRLAHAQQLMLAKGSGGGLAGFGAGGVGTGIGLATELSGRHVVDSPVAAAPVVVEARPVECELPRSLQLYATVHVLVTREGAAAVPRLLLSSGFPGFDRCALRYVLAMRFSPGLDAKAHPLDVWMDVRVAPVTATQVGAARPDRAAP